uniref:restriction endonuclease n=1 Tax=Pedobacter schmidteae TaxID=2201271 RepID=UPI000EB0B3C2|nr:restriction endonuclease [Pedobacter schmidteae]
MAETPKIPILIQKAAEIQARLSAIPPIPQPAKLIHRTYFSSTLMTLAELRRRNTSITKLFEAKNLLDRYYDNAYLQTLLKYLPQLDDQDELEVNTFDLVEQIEKDPAQRIILLNEVPKAQGLIRSVYNDHQRLYQLHPRDFEEMIAELLRKKGWDIQLTKQTRDQGVDIIALRYLDDSPLKAVIECKRNAPKRKVGVEILRGFQSVIATQQANKGIIFTSSYFSTDAIQYQQQHMPFLMELKDYDDIIGWINDEGIC